MRFPVILLSAILLLCTAGLLVGQKTGLLIVDIQEFYFPGGKMQLEDPETAGMNAGLILDQFRISGLPVYHVRHNYEPGGDFHAYVEPREGEPVISKDQVNPFLDTPLLELIVSDTVDRLVICGMQTHMCVEAAVRAAHDLGISCILVSDACATRALQYNEHIIPAKNVHHATLESLRGTYAEILTTEKLLRDFDQFSR